MTAPRSQRRELRRALADHDASGAFDGSTGCRILTQLRAPHIRARNFPISSHRQRRRALSGFTLVELLLVTVIVGLLASISAPFVQAARDKTFVTAAMADLRNLEGAIEAYVTMESRRPTSLADLTDNDYYTNTNDVSVCLFIPIPEFSWRPASFLLVLAHAGSGTAVYTVYPIYGGRIEEFNTGDSGCGLWQ
jgi:prepilin-type N-terminal cleavage/methylation domain-containing protein